MRLYFHGDGVMVFDSFVWAMMMCLGGCEGEDGIGWDGGRDDMIGKERKSDGWEWVL